MHTKRANVAAQGGSWSCYNLGLRECFQHSIGKAGIACNHKLFTRRAPYGEVDRPVSDVIIPVHAERRHESIRFYFASEVCFSICREATGNTADAFGQGLNITAV